MSHITHSVSMRGWRADPRHGEDALTGDVEVRTVEIKRTEINRTERLRNYTHVHAHVLYKSDFWQRNRMHRQPREARPDGERAADESCSLPACSLHARTFVVSSSSLIFRRLGGGVAVGHPLLEELYLVENVTHCVFALKARRRRQFLGERWTQHIDLAELHFFLSRTFFRGSEGSLIWNKS